MRPAFPSPAATVIVVAYNSGDFLQPCIDALAAQTFADFEAVVVDNASQDRSVADLTVPDARFRHLAMGFNAGFAVANNRAAQASEAEFLVLLNPDTVADPGWLAALVAAARAHPEAASVGSLQLRLDNPAVMDGVGDVWHVAGLAWRAGEGKSSTSAPPDGDIFGPCAAAALYRREAFAALGGFEERFFCYCEDVDLAFRLRLGGLRFGAGLKRRRAPRGVGHRREGLRFRPVSRSSQPHLDLHQEHDGGLVLGTLALSPRLQRLLPVSGVAARVPAADVEGLQTRVGGARTVSGGAADREARAQRRLASAPNGLEPLVAVVPGAEAEGAAAITLVFTTTLRSPCPDLFRASIPYWRLQAGGGWTPGTSPGEEKN